MFYSVLTLKTNRLEAETVTRPHCENMQDGVLCQVVQEILNFLLIFHEKLTLGIDSQYCIRV